MFIACFATRSATVATWAVAYDAGFSDLSYFNRRFRKQYGLTPIDIREANVNSRRTDEMPGRKVDQSSPLSFDRALSRKRHLIFGAGISGRYFCYKPEFVVFAGKASRAINLMSLHQTD